MKYRIKDIPKEYANKSGKSFLRFKRKMKKISHTQLRRGKGKYIYTPKWKIIFDFT